MDVLLLIDNNQRAAIACLRSLSARGIRVYPAVQASNGKKHSFLRYTRYKQQEQDLLTYQEDDAESLYASFLRIRDRIGGPYVIFPAGEATLRQLVPQKSRLSEAGIVVPVPDIDQYRMVSDKFSFASLAERCGIRVPKLIPELPQRFDGSFVVKAKTGQSGQEGVAVRPILVETQKAYDCLKHMRLNWNLHFLQEYLRGQSYYYCALYHEGKPMLRFTQKTLAQQPGGLSVIKAAPATLPESLIVKADRMMADLHWHGVMMMEFRKEREEYYAIECNPRFWGPLQLSLDNGVDFPVGLWQLATEQSIENATPPARPVGYCWWGGYVKGIGIGHETATAFQIGHPAESDRIRYRDVWCRRDTFRFFIYDLVRSGIRSLAVCVGAMTIRRRAESSGG